MKNHDWILANLFNVMAYAEREGLETVSSAIEQAIFQISPTFAVDAEGSKVAARQPLPVVSSSPRQ